MIGAGADAKGNPQYVVVGMVGRGDSQVYGSHPSWIKMPSFSSETAGLLRSSLIQLIS